MSDASKYMGVLLAAGKGTRMAGLSEHYPKPILPIGNKPLLVHHVELLAELGITEIIILIGHKGFEIVKVLGDGSQFGVQLHYVEQTQMLGIAHAVGQLESVVSKPFLLFLGDIYFVPRDIGAMLRIYETQQGGAVLAVKREKDPAAIMRNFSVLENEDGRVVRVIEKPRHVINDLKGVGLYCFDLSIFDAIRRTPRTAMRDEYEITEAIQVLIDDGVTVRTAAEIHDDINITYPEDLLRLNIKLAQSGVGGNLIHPDAVIHPEARIGNSVIGAKAQVTEPLTMTNCLLFDRAILNGVSVLANAIVTPEKTLKCQLDLDAL